MSEGPSDNEIPPGGEELRPDQAPTGARWRLATSTRRRDTRQQHNSRGLEKIGSWPTSKGDNFTSILAKQLWQFAGVQFCLFLLIICWILQVRSVDRSLILNLAFADSSWRSLSSSTLTFRLSLDVKRQKILNFQFPCLFLFDIYCWIRRNRCADNSNNKFSCLGSTSISWDYLVQITHSLGVGISRLSSS
jgi:hypothetical protein